MMKIMQKLTTWKTMNILYQKMKRSHFNGYAKEYMVYFKISKGIF